MWLLLSPKTILAFFQEAMEDEREMIEGLERRIELRTGLDEGEERTENDAAVPYDEGEEGDN